MMMLVLPTTNNGAGDASDDADDPNDAGDADDADSHPPLCPCIQVVRKQA